MDNLAIMAVNGTLHLIDPGAPVACLPKREKVKVGRLPIQFSVHLVGSQGDVWEEIMKMKEKGQNRGSKGEKSNTKRMKPDDSKKKWDEYGMKELPYWLGTSVKKLKEKEASTTNQDNKAQEDVSRQKWYLKFYIRENGPKLSGSATALYLRGVQV